LLHHSDYSVLLLVVIKQNNEFSYFTMNDLRMIINFDLDTSIDDDDRIENFQNPNCHVW
jgi:hypothetical protein